GVPDVLLDGPAVVLDALPRIVEVQLVAVSDVLWVGPVRPRGRPDDVHEQDRHELPLFLRRALLVAEGRAERSTVGKVGTAAHTGHGTHRRGLRRVGASRRISRSGGSSGR